ncbi:DNA-processing protein DprA [uncultured Sphaerochaeta sp.]|uniref:DNA-processing protein DprA n=1 Tax=uncultured Sphaerochaeta sp. TaxID=886478 RepID=UPI002A0A4A4A|nr:DNA-processing protein DprA [uncultured Sphaerochaeta sp.]
MDKKRHQALNFQSMVVASKNSETKAMEAFAKLLPLLDTFEPLVLHISEYSHLLGVAEPDLSAIYYTLRPAFESMDEQVQVLTWEDPLWPKQTKGFAYCPRFLYVLGDLSLLAKPSLSIIGTRSPSLEGLSSAALTAQAIGSKGYGITSGLARGIDGVAHKTALASGYPTLAVIGTPIGSCYPPEHKELQQEIARKGAVVSRFAPSENTQKWFFLLRNRLMSALSLASVVIEDRDGGGAVRQASFALEQKKYLFLYQGSLDNQAILWPREFAGKPRVFIVKKAPDIPRLLAKALEMKASVGKTSCEKEEKPLQLDLFSL